MPSPDSDTRGGFALALVVLLLFAVGVAGATGYQIVHGEWDMAVQSSEGQTALGLARGGLQKYLAEQVGAFEDTVTYSLNGGDAVVAARKVADVSDFSSLYLLSSEGVYSDPSTVQSPARRTVYQYAVHRETPVDWMAAVIQASGLLDVENGSTVAGGDTSTILDCAEGGGAAVAGVARGGDSVAFNPLDITGSSDSVSYGSYTGLMNALDLSWSTLIDPSFPVDVEGVFPDATGFPADSFPVVRFNTSTVGYGWNSGRGVLIVNGSFQPQWTFMWDGIILTSHFNPVVTGYAWERPYTIRGIVVSGLGGGGATTFLNSDGSIAYHRCNVLRAARSLAHFRPIGNTWWESM